ncbi:carbonic anhydrase-related protein 10 [Trichonephila inaurata madagascariensis]|uniref:Carbonic anhydrase-related protein 10 n=1 Tax=Trichonephila inaurata madagascariensis TaxID=2747483 RepID=A0A8X7BWZ2_9ARAC|nr:carbonic anhydrase-related protein 10 [Trichonephila inaurata madagascariensis]
MDKASDFESEDCRFESCPDYWGLLNPDWKLCNRGRRQSPIDIEPPILLFDPGMGNIEISTEKVRSVKGICPVRVFLLFVFVLRKLSLY